MQIEDWRTFQSPLFKDLTQKLGQISNIRPDHILILFPDFSDTIFTVRYKNALDRLWSRLNNILFTN